MHSQRLMKAFVRYFILFSVFALAARNANISQQGAAPASSAAPFLGNGSPKGPGSAALTATALATPVPIICQLPAVTAPDTQGWQTYTDHQYPFHFSFPSDWKVGQTMVSSADGSDSSYEGSQHFFLVFFPLSELQ
jgi:hypothetical protein